MAGGFPPAQRHGPIQEVLPDVFVVTGTLRSEARGLSITRNMVILRHEGELAVVNSVRLGEQGEAELDALGRVTQLVKLGASHGIDDPYYVDRYRPTLWAPPGSTHKGGLQTDRELAEEGPGPLPGAGVFLFRNTVYPEAILCLEAGGGTLVTADAITNVVDLEGTEGMERIYTRENGHLRRASIGAPWRNAMTPEHGPPLLLEYQRLLELPFANLISAHGPPLMETAKEDLKETLRYLFGARKL